MKTRLSKKARLLFEKIGSAAEKGHPLSIADVDGRIVTSLWTRGLLSGTCFRLIPSKEGKRVLSGEVKIL